MQTPNWVKHAIFYQIFPDRFARSTSPKFGLWQSNNLESWSSPPTLQGYKGGDLWGVSEKLDYLQDLGITAIYFTPIFQSASNHRYHTHDYYQVDPMLGGNIAFEKLLETAHKRDIKIILDGVFNHASRGFFFFNDILEHGPHSAWLDWFKVEAWPLSAYDGAQPANYVSWVDNRALPQFNHQNPQVREYIMQIAEFWLNKGIDGWRLDVPDQIETAGFWQEFRTRVKAINPEAYIVGEIWKDAREWLDGTQFDGVMNYLFTEATIAFVVGDRLCREYVDKIPYYPYPALSAVEYGEKIQQILALYPWEIQLTQLNLLDSHDTARLITIAGGDQTSVELATLLLLTFPGAPNIYYGDEVGLEGGIDPDCRRGFPTPDNWNLTVLSYHQKLIKLRREHIALRIGDYQIIKAEEALYIFARTWQQEKIIVAINVGTNKASTVIDLATITNNYNCLYGDVDIGLLGEQLAITLLPRSGCILQIS